MIRVLIAEDQAMLLSALGTLLDLEDDLEVVALAKNGKEALELARTTAPDIVLTDIEMPELGGLELAERIRDEQLAGGVIIVTTFARSGYLRRALDAGARGYLLKDSPGDVLPNAIRRVHAGGRAIDPVLAEEAWSEPDPLTDREQQVLRFCAEGWSNARIAEELGLHEGTVRNYVSEAISKLDATNRVDAARIARDKGWL
ncbi:MAG: response regulator transcription factor [Gammaproteobacteria bacterium]|nr:response regulator transcription factor [Gammaproteobacteria bacterium]